MTAPATIQIGYTLHPDATGALVATSAEGHLIGPVELAALIVGARAIVPELAAPEDTVCTVGRSALDGKWYGWGWPLVGGFGVGDVVAAGSVLASDGGYAIGTRAETEADARAWAVAFARCVGP